jgi:hypothetical protein
MEDGIVLGTTFDGHAEAIGLEVNNMDQLIFLNLIQFSGFW